MFLGLLQTPTNGRYLTTRLSINGTTAHTTIWGHTTPLYKDQHARIRSAYQKEQFPLGKTYGEMIVNQVKNDAEVLVGDGCKNLKQQSDYFKNKITESPAKGLESC